VSKDAGATWSIAQSNVPSGGKLVVLPDSSGHLLLAAGSGLWQASGNPTAPVLAANSSVTSANLVGFGKAAAGASNLTLFLYGKISGGSATTAELFTSLDGGTTWSQINDDAHQWGGGVDSLSGDMRTFGTVYVGTNGRGVIWGTIH
jgi:hypothetical protein